MAGSTIRSSFGYSSSTPNSSPRSSPPSTSSIKSRLPVYSRSKSGTPSRAASSTTTATRSNLTPVVKQSTPSPHPSPDDGAQIKVIYGRVEEKHVEAPGQPDGTLSPAGSTEQEDVNKQDKNQASQTTITFAPCKLNKAVGTAETCEEPKTSGEYTYSLNGSDRAQANFSHPGRTRVGRHSTGSSSTRSAGTSTSDHDKTTTTSSATSRLKSGFTSSSTSRSALVELPAELPKALFEDAKASIKHDQDIASSAFKPDHSARTNVNDGLCRSVRLPGHSDSTESRLGPILRVSEDAEGLLRGAEAGPTTGRLRMPSFGTTSSEESVVSNEAGSAARSAALLRLGKNLKAPAKSTYDDDCDLVGRRAFSEKRVRNDYYFSPTNNLMRPKTRQTLSNTSQASQDLKDIKSTSLTTKDSVLQDHRPSPHPALLFSRTFLPNDDSHKPSGSKDLVNSTTSPNPERASTYPSSPPDPPPKDTPSIEDRIRSLSPSKHLPRRPMKSGPPPPSKKLADASSSAVKPRLQKLPVARPSAFVEKWSSPLPAREHENTVPLDHFSPSLNSRSKVITSENVQPSLRHSQSKKLSRSISRPRLLPSNIRNLFHRRSNNEISPFSVKAPRHTTIASSASTGPTWSSSQPTSIPAPGRAHSILTTPPTATRPNTRGKPLIVPPSSLNILPSPSITSADDILKRGTNLALHLTHLASSPTPSNPTTPHHLKLSPRASPALARESALSLARTLVTVITASRDAEAASISASARAEEAKVAADVAREGVGECVRLVERCLF